jgi:hypothetical protein
VDAYLDPDKALSLEEFKPAKVDLVRQKQQARDELAAFEASHETWLEPAIRFVKESKRAGILGREGTSEEKRDFFKKVASNPNVFNRELRFEPRGAWRIVLGQRSFAQDSVAPDISGATFPGETRLTLQQRRLLDKVRTFFKDNPTWK